MDLYAKNPCDLCEQNGTCSDGTCALSVSAQKSECVQYDCFLNNDGSCILGLFENCGAWKG